MRFGSGSARDAGAKRREDDWAENREERREASSGESCSRMATGNEGCGFALAGSGPGTSAANALKGGRYSRSSSHVSIR